VWARLRLADRRAYATSLLPGAAWLAAVALCLALVAALSVGFYGLFVLYQHSR